MRNKTLKNPSPELPIQQLRQATMVDGQLPRLSQIFVYRNKVRIVSYLKGRVLIGRGATLAEALSELEQAKNRKIESNTLKNVSHV